MAHEFVKRRADLQAGDIVVFLQVSTTGKTKFTCGKFECFADDENHSIILTTGRIPEWDNYGVVCMIHPLAAYEDVPILPDGVSVEVHRE